MRQLNLPVISAADASANQNSSVIDAYNLFRASALATFSSATLNGTVVLQGSNDISTANNLAVDQTPTNWVTIPNTSQTVTSGAAVLIPSTEICYRWIRVVWTKSSGTGTITVNLTALGY